MKNEFIPHEQAIELKELGFNDPCISFWNNIGGYYDQKGWYDWNKTENFFSIPLYQQAFRWFREKHNLRSFVDIRVYDVDSPNQWIYDFQIKMGGWYRHPPFYSGDFDSYEDAELACLKKLIEIVKK